MKKIHLMAICGKGMGSLAGMLKESGYEVRGSDEHVYPPMSTQLEEMEIPTFEGFQASNLDWQPEYVVVGNVITRVNPEAVALRERGLPHGSFPQTLAEFFIRDRHSIVVTGTHGKTTTTGAIAWALHQAGRDPGFMVGGIMNNFGNNYRVGNGQYFVVEGDEYDSAYFDKIPKFLHYRPRTGLLTSVEFDHADIYDSLDRIKQEFTKFIHLIPADGLLVACADDPNVREVIQTATSPVETYGLHAPADWTITNIQRTEGVTAFTVACRGTVFGTLHTTLIGRHNLLNLLGATAVLSQIGLTPAEIDAGFRSYQGVKCRQEVRGVVNGITVLDDFAHHPTAVKVTIDAVKEHYFQLPSQEAGLLSSKCDGVHFPKWPPSGRVSGMGCSLSVLPKATDSPPGRGKGWVLEPDPPTDLVTHPQPLPGGEFTASPCKNPYLSASQEGVGLSLDTTRHPVGKLWSVFEPATATSRRDVFQHDYIDAFAQADVAIIADVYRPEKAPAGHVFSSEQLARDLRQRNIAALHISGVDNIVTHLAEQLQPGDVVLIMSNGGFGGIHDKLLNMLRAVRQD